MPWQYGVRAGERAPAKIAWDTSLYLPLEVFKRSAVALVRVSIEVLAKKLRSHTREMLFGILFAGLHC